MRKLAFRLVPNLEPELVMNLIRKHPDRSRSQDVPIIPMGEQDPAKSSLDAPVVEAAMAAARAIYPKEPVVYPSTAIGAPMYVLSQALGTPAVLGVRVGNSAARSHSPRQHIHLRNYVHAIEHTAEVSRPFAG